MYELANISFADNKPEEAERLIRKAVTVSPENEWYWVLLSDIYKRVNKIDDLVFVLEELSRISPKNEAYYYDRANALLILKRVEDAEMHMMKLKSDLVLPKILFQRGSVFLCNRVNRLN